MNADRFRPYSRRKSSGVRWIGEVPCHWEVQRLKYVAAVFSGGTPDMGKPEYWNGDIPWVSPKDMGTARIMDTQDHITPQGLANSSTQLVEPNAVLIVVRSGILRHSIPVAINVVPVAINQDIRALVPDGRLLPTFLRYLVNGNQRQILLDWGKQGATVESIETPYMMNGLVPVPPLHDQELIVAFLDRETARIDALVAKKRRLIELLEEKRTALISHAVTKGLDPDVPMKDSGDPWVGPIPRHWDYKSLGCAVRYISYGFTNPMPVSDEGPFMLTANDIADGYIDYENARRTTEHAYQVELTDKSRPRKDDVLITKDGTLGRVAVSNGTVA